MTTKTKNLIFYILFIILGIAIYLPLIECERILYQLEDEKLTTGLVGAKNTLPEVVYVDKTARVTCYVDMGLTASGEYVRHGIVAVSDRTIPMDSQLYLEGFGIMDVRDKTAKWVHDKYPVMTIDVWMTAEDCKEFGLKYLTYKLI